MSTIKLVLTLTLVGALAGVRGALAVDPEQSCQTGRAKAAGRYAQCIQAEVAKSYVGVFHADSFGKCATKYGATYTKLQAKALASPAAETCDAARYVDNGDGTVTDNLSAVVWEKKTTDATVHDAGNVYSWSAGGMHADGTAYTGFLATVNGTGFAGQRDWRLPTVAELLSITQPAYPACMTPPCIAPIFGPTLDFYWSSTRQLFPVDAGVVNFLNGFPLLDGLKTDSRYVRAVRGGF